MSFNVGDVVLGGVDLNNSLQWSDRFNHTGVAAKRERTLGGGLVVFSQDLTAGQPITLVATVDTGWFTYAMVIALKALADSSGSSYTLDYHGELHTVRFDYQSNKPVAFTPLIPKNAYANDTDYFIGTMKLFTV